MKHTLLLVPLLLSFPAGRAHAQEPERPSVRVDGAVYLTGLLRREPYFDKASDGSLWAVGNSYKASFDEEGATFVPFFGSDAPRNLPVRLRVASVRTGAGEIAFARDVAPVREGTSVSYERGAFVERYELGLEGMEQSFLVRERAGAGSLVIELAVESDLAPSAEGADLVFRGERGHVRYTGAVAIDARGERVAAPTRFHEGRIEIEVPQTELARLRFPLVVDPMISTFNFIPPTVIDGRSPDVAYDQSTDLWCVVFERAFSASDNDVFTTRLDQSGQALWDSTIDSSSVSWSTPRLAVNRAASQVLIVASVGAPGARRIWGRTMPAFFVGPGSWIPISPAGGDCIAPDVGGDSSLDVTSYYCVVWQRVNSASDSDVFFRMVRPNGTLPGNAIGLAGPIGTSEILPSISTCNGTGTALERIWTVAWQRFALFDSDLYFARIAYDGLVMTSALALETTIFDTRLPSVSSPMHDADGRVAIAYMRGSVGNTDTFLFVLRGSTVEQQVSLNYLTSTSSSPNHLYPNVDCDGRDFVVVETESIPSTGLYTLYASTLRWLGNSLAVAEGHTSLIAAGSTAPIPRAACSGAGGGAPRRSLFAWHWEGFGPNPTLWGSLYDAGSFATLCEPGRNGVMACPCGNAPIAPGRGCNNSSTTGGARLAGSGTVAPDTVTLTASEMKPSALCLLAQTSSYSAPSAFGDGVLCVGGTVRRMGAKAASAGQASWPGPAEPSISARSAALGDPLTPGSGRFYFVYYRDPDAGWACGPTFNATHALHILW